MQGCSLPNLRTRRQCSGVLGIVRCRIYDPDPCLLPEAQTRVCLVEAMGVCIYIYIFEQRRAGIGHGVSPGGIKTTAAIDKRSSTLP